jgi:two-component system sensor histidine kinase BaeS
MGRLASLRVWLLAAMLGTGAVGIVLAYLMGGSIQRSHEASEDRQKAQLVANAVAVQAMHGASRRQLASLQRVLVSDQLIIVRHGRAVFTGRPLRSREVEVTVSARFPGGKVTLIDHESSESGASTAALVAGLAVAALVISAALAVSSLITRSVREPLARAIDVSDRIAAGDLSARMGASGPDALSHLGAAMDGMAGRLQQEDHERRRFLADVAHEIATPVNTIAGYAEAIADGTAAPGAEREAARRAIADAGERVARLLGALRELTTLDLYGEVHAEPLELAGLVGDVVERQRPAAAERGVELTVDVAQASLVSDRRLLETILENLLTNAIRYTPAGGRVSVGARTSEDTLEVSVTDTGPGIDPDQQRMVFDDLYRTDEARQVTTGGAGLGLSIARRAAQALHGSISLESVPGSGSTFTLRVPERIAQSAGAR